MTAAPPSGSFRNASLMNRVFFRCMFGEYLCHCPLCVAIFRIEDLDSAAPGQFRYSGALFYIRRAGGDRKTEKSAHQKTPCKRRLIAVYRNVLRLVLDVRKINAISLIHTCGVFDEYLRIA